MWLLSVFGLLMAGAALIYCVQNLFLVWTPKAQIWTTAGWIGFLALWAFLLGALLALAWYWLSPLIASIRSGNPDRISKGLNDLGIYIARSVFWALFPGGIGGNCFGPARSNRRGYAGDFW